MNLEAQELKYIHTKAKLQIETLELGDQDNLEHSKDLGNKRIVERGKAGEIKLY